MNLEQFIEQLKQHNIVLTQEQLEQFEWYYQLLIQWNERMNLTAITDREEVYLKHFYDSLMPLWLTPEAFQPSVGVVDIGAGAGFPSIPLKIVRPDLHITMVDSLNKRITFLNEVIERLHLTNIEAKHSRAEDFGHDSAYRENYGIAIARAVASLSVLAEYCVPLVQKGGYFIAMKGQKAQEELSNASTALDKLGAKYISSRTQLLPIEESEREILLIKKVLNTPRKYPRKAGMPSKKPL